MGHSTVRCAKTAEPIDMPFWMKTRVGPRYHVLDRGADHSRRSGNFWGCTGHSKALAIFAAALLQKGSFNRQWRHAADGIIQYNRQEQVVFWKFLGACDGPIGCEGGGGIAQRGRSVISSIALFCRLLLSLSVINVINEPRRASDKYWRWIAYWKCYHIAGFTYVGSSSI